MRITALLLAALALACTDDAPPPRAETPSAAHAIRVRPAAAAEPMRPADEPQTVPAMAGAPAPPGAETAALASADAAEREQAVLDFEGDLAELAPLATDDPSADVRRAAVQRLAEGDRPVERAALRRALEDADPSVVAEAILALEALGEKSARPALERLRAHRDPEVRALADEALDSLLAGR